MPVLRTIQWTPNLKAGIIIMSILPILVLCRLLERCFRKGVTLGALKG